MMVNQSHFWSLQPSRKAFSPEKNFLKAFQIRQKLDAQFLPGSSKKLGRKITCLGRCSEQATKNGLSGKTQQAIFKII